MVLICKEPKVTADERQEPQKVNFDLQSIGKAVAFEGVGAGQGGNLHQILL